MPLVIPALRRDKLQDVELLLPGELKVVPVAAGERLNPAEQEVNVNDAGGDVLAALADVELKDLPAVL